MQVGELSAQSGCSVATIKYYLREGLLQPGEKTSPTRAEYGDAHLARLRLIRALVDVGGLSIAAARAVIEAVEDPDTTADEAIERAVDRLGPPISVHDDARFRTAHREVDSLIRRKGWTVEGSPTAIDLLASALVSLRDQFGNDVPVEVFDPYGDVALEVARNELAGRPEGIAASDFVAWAVAGTVVFERVLLAWRRLAHAHLAHELRHSDGSDSARSTV